MQTPVIISVFDTKLRNIDTAVVDYNDIDATLEQIKKACEKNQWIWKLKVPTSSKLFIHNINFRGSLEGTY